MHFHPLQLGRLKMNNDYSPASVRLSKMQLTKCGPPSIDASAFSLRSLASFSSAKHRDWTRWVTRRWKSPCGRCAHLGEILARKSENWRNRNDSTRSQRAEVRRLQIRCRLSKWPSSFGTEGEEGTRPMEPFARAFLGLYSAQRRNVRHSSSSNLTGTHLCGLWDIRGLIVDVSMFKAWLWLLKKIHHVLNM